MKFFLLFISLTYVAQVNAQIITTVVGNGTPGFSGDGGQATSAKINYPLGVAFDAIGNMYFVDDANSRIRKVSTTGIISTVAGGGTMTGDSILATSAQLNFPQGIAFDSNGNMYFGDHNRSIRKVDANGIITTVAGNSTYGYSGDGGPATSAQLYNQTLITFDAFNNMFIADYGNHRIRMVNSSGIINTVAGNGTAGYSGDGGPATSAQLNYPNGITIDNLGNMYIADASNNRIRKVNTNGIITTIAGIGTAGYSGDGGVATLAELKTPSCISIDGSGNIFIADAGNNRIRMIDASGIINTIVGNGIGGYSGDGGSPTLAEINLPQVICLQSGNLYITDTQNARIRRVTNVTGVLSFNNQNNSFSIFPNPSSNNITLTCSKNIDEIKVKNVLGKQITCSTEVKNSSSVIDVSLLENGIYFVTITSGKENSTQKLIVQH